jgi:hypothetical protein
MLFIGNSHTYCNGLPYQVREMVLSAGVPDGCETWMIAPGGKSLGWHAGEPGTQLNIVCHPWDLIVLQQATHPFGGYGQLAEDYGKLEPFLARSGAEVLFYVTWKRKAAPESDQDDLNDAFERLSREKGGRLVPVGPAWRLARQKHAEIELYADDGAHASPAGTYLGACVFFGIVTGKRPRGLPARIAVNGTSLADLAPAQSAALQAVAAEILGGAGTGV